MRLIKVDSGDRLVAMAKVAVEETPVGDSTVIAAEGGETPSAGESTDGETPQ